MPLDMTYVRHRKSSQTFSLFTMTSSVVTSTAGVNGAAVNTSGYTGGTFFSHVTLNTSGAPSIYLDVGVVPTGLTTTAWSQYATIHTDLTTTANNEAIGVNNIPDLVRGRIAPVTTTASVTTVTCIVDAILKA